jgi:hypothetical protein
MTDQKTIDEAVGRLTYDDIMDLIENNVSICQCGCGSIQGIDLAAAAIEAALSASNARALAAEEALRRAATDMRQQAEASAGNLKRFGCDAHMVDICLDHFKYQADRIDATLASMKEKG